jgi:hypothetical protein
LVCISVVTPFKADPHITVTTSGVQTGREAGIIVRAVSIIALLLEGGFVYAVPAAFFVDTPIAVVVQHVATDFHTRRTTG